MGNGRSPKVSYFLNDGDSRDDFFDGNNLYNFGTILDQDFNDYMNKFADEYESNYDKYSELDDANLDALFAEQGSRIVWYDDIDPFAMEDLLSPYGIKGSDIRYLGDKFQLDSVDKFKELSKNVDFKELSMERPQLAQSIQSLLLDENATEDILGQLYSLTNPKNLYQELLKAAVAKRIEFVSNSPQGGFIPTTDYFYNINMSVHAIGKLNQVSIDAGLPPIPILKLSDRPLSSTYREARGIYYPYAEPKLNSIGIKVSAMLDKRVDAEGLRVNNPYSYDARQAWTIPSPISTPVHEYGHHIDYSLGRNFKPSSRRGITEYGNSNREEAFAEAFVAYTHGFKKTNYGNDYYQEFREYMEQNSLNTFEGFFLKNSIFSK